MPIMKDGAAHTMLHKSCCEASLIYLHFSWHISSWPTGFYRGLHFFGKRKQFNSSSTNKRQKNSSVLNETKYLIIDFDFNIPFGFVAMFFWHHGFIQQRFDWTRKFIRKKCKKKLWLKQLQHTEFCRQNLWKKSHPNM